MKITLYELLGLIKDGKAPKKIKYEYSIYELTPKKDNYYCIDELGWFTNEINSLEVLNNEVEIIEEDKKIGFEEIEELTCGAYDFETQTINIPTNYDYEEKHWGILLDMNEIEYLKIEPMLEKEND